MNTIRSHYLPKTYLKHFLNENSLFMYKKGEKFFKDTNIKPQDRILEIIGEDGLSVVGVKKHLYDPGIEGYSSDDMEEIFQEYGENTYDGTIIDIENLAVNSDITDSIKNSLCLIMGSMRVRTPLYKKELEEMDEVMRKHLMATNFERLTDKEIVRNTKEISGQDITLKTASEIRDNFVNKKYELKYPNAYFIKYALLLLEHHIDIFHQMTMTICKSNSRYFITNDNPLVYFVPQKYVNMYNPPKGLVTSHCEVFFPLTKNLAVHLSWRKEKEQIRQASRELIDIFNYNLSHNSLDYIFSPMKINELDIFTQEYIPYPFKFSMR